MMIVQPSWPRLAGGMVLASVILMMVSCVHDGANDTNATMLRTPEGLARWQHEDGIMQSRVQLKQKQYQQDMSLEQLKGYEITVREYLDHGFDLYRSYRSAKLVLPAELVPSLEKRTGLLMDVADEYIKHGSLAVGEGIAADVVHDYADLPTMAPAQRRAEAVLMRYRYRQDY